MTISRSWNWRKRGSLLATLLDYPDEGGSGQSVVIGAAGLYLRLEVTAWRDEGWLAWRKKRGLFPFPASQDDAVSVYHDPDDWWVGYYRGSQHHFVCPLPTIVIRWPR